MLTVGSSLYNKGCIYTYICKCIEKEEGRGALSCCQWLYLGMGVGGKEHFTFCFCIFALSFQLEHINVSHTSIYKAIKILH